MFEFLLATHSLVRWLVLISLTATLLTAYFGRKHNRAYTIHDDQIRKGTVIIAHVQLTLGLMLYILSPMVNYFLNNFKEAVHMREIRFFGMEHITMMVVAVTIITIGSVKAKRKKTDKEKFRTVFIWFLVALIIIFLSIPWSFSPFTSRPLFRPF